ncbi:hypothetical protein FJ366_02050 [Candidatus Dependentiae bacterium]|nr:hypothetical protein [Candidatus Dependentiae bacterium]
MNKKTFLVIVFCLSGAVFSEPFPADDSVVAEMIAAVTQLVSGEITPQNFEVEAQRCQNALNIFDKCERVVDGKKVFCVLMLNGIKYRFEKDHAAQVCDLAEIIGARQDRINYLDRVFKALSARRILLETTHKNACAVRSIFPGLDLASAADRYYGYSSESIDSESNSDDDSASVNSQESRAPSPRSWYSE